MSRRLQPRMGRRRGMTLIELLLAIAGTGLVAAATAMMMHAVAAGTSSRGDMRQAVVRHKTVAGRVSTMVRSSYQVLAAQEDVLVLWLGDADGNKSPNLAEICRVERDAATSQLRCYRAEAGLDPAANTAYPIESDFAAVTEQLRDTALYPHQLWATGVSQWEVSIDADDPREAALISSRLTFDFSGMRDTAIAAVALRNTGDSSFISDNLLPITSDDDDPQEPLSRRARLRALIKWILYYLHHHHHND